MKILTLPNGRYRVDVIINGRRQRKNFSSRIFAEAYLKQSSLEALEARMGIDRLTAQQRADAQLVYRLLAPDQDLLQIVRDYQSRQPRKSSYSMELAVDEFLGGLNKENRRSSYIGSIAKPLRKLQHWAETLDLYEITPEVIKEFLDKEIKQTPVNRFNYIRDLHVFFEFCKREEYLAENPVANIRRPKVVRKEPSILTLEQAKNMLGESVGADRAFAALGMFAGIRPHEVRQMNWEMVNVETGCIRLPASITKTNMTRSIQLEPNVIKWLIPLKNEAPQLALDAACQTNRVMIAGGLEAWPQGVLRHTFASYHVTAFENPGRTALFMHCRTSPDILFRHYFKDTLKSDALKFWQIEP